MKISNFILGLLFLSLICCNNNSEKIKLEPDDIIFKDKLGNRISRAELINVTGKVNYEIMNTQNINPRAQSLHQEARELGQNGKYALSIAKLEEAIKIQPDWAYPTYDLAYTYLLQGDFENALKFYKKTDELEPKGFFTTKTALYSLEREHSGKFPKGLYIAYMQIEWADDSNKKLEIAKAITEKVPDFAPAWKELSVLINDKNEKLKAIEQGLIKNPDAETKGILEINKAILINEYGKSEEAKEILGKIVFSPDSTMSNIALAKFTLKSIMKI